VTESASYFTADVGGKTVTVFAVRDELGRAHVALDTCHTWAPTKGYQQVGDAMRCRKCGKGFPVAFITAMAGAGGCHPVSLPAREEGGALVFARADVEAGARWF